VVQHGEGASLWHAVAGHTLLLVLAHVTCSATSSHRSHMCIAQCFDPCGCQMGLQMGAAQPDLEHHFGFADTLHACVQQH
jgi:hypothetical protein